MISSLWDLFNIIIFIRNLSTAFRTFFLQKNLSPLCFLWNMHVNTIPWLPRDQWNNETMIFIFWYCVITCRLCNLLYKKFNISFNILLLLYDFHRFKQKPWRQHFSKQWLRNTKVIYSCIFPQNTKFT